VYNSCGYTVKLKRDSLLAHAIPLDVAKVDSAEKQVVQSHSRADSTADVTSRNLKDDKKSFEIPKSISSGAICTLSHCDVISNDVKSNESAIKVPFESAERSQLECDIDVQIRRKQIFDELVAKIPAELFLTRSPYW
jgi:hypothetical protein